MTNGMIKIGGGADCREDAKMIKYCCDEMEWSDTIRFNPLLQCFEVVVHLHEDYYAGIQEKWFEWKEMMFCPFCGHALKITLT